MNKITKFLPYVAIALIVIGSLFAALPVSPAHASAPVEIVLNISYSAVVPVYDYAHATCPSCFPFLGTVNGMFFVTLTNLGGGEYGVKWTGSGPFKSAGGKIGEGTFIYTATFTGDPGLTAAGKALGLTMFGYQKAIPPDAEWSTYYTDGEYTNIQWTWTLTDDCGGYYQLTMPATGPFPFTSKGNPNSLSASCVQPFIRDPLLTMFIIPAANGNGFCHEWFHDNDTGYPTPANETQPGSCGSGFVGTTRWSKYYYGYVGQTPTFQDAKTGILYDLPYRPPLGYGK